MKPKHNEFDSTNVFMFFIRWWKHLGVICILAAVGAAIFSGPRFITPKFESRVSMFPTTSGSISQSVFVQGEDFLEYGEIEDAERLLQVLGSVAVRNKIIDRFDLMSHYEISPDSRYRQTDLSRQYESNISSRRTPYGAVEVSVRDKDPAMAAEIANEIAALADTVQNQIRYQRALQAYEIAQKRFQDMQQEVKSLEDSLRRVMRSGVYDIEGQSSMLTRQLAKDVSANNQDGVRALEQRLDVISDHGGAYIFLAAQLKDISETVAYIQRRDHEAKADLENFVSFKFILDEAYEAERKVYPVRWLIVFLVTFAAGFMGVMTLMVYENLVNKGIINTGKTPKPAKS